MELNKLIIRKNNKKEIYDVLFVIESTNDNYIAYNKENNVYFAKVKPNGTKIQNVTKKEKEFLNKFLSNFNDEKEVVNVK